MVEYVKYFILSQLQAKYSTLYHENTRCMLPFECQNSKTFLLHTQCTLIYYYRVGLINAKRNTRIGCKQVMQFALFIRNKK